MARRKSTRGSKIQPAVQTLTFATPGSGAASVYIDLSQAASLANRRFYRQGINWAVAGIKVISLQPGSVNCFKLPNTWIMSNAWEKGFRHWHKQQLEAVSSSSDGVMAKFNDFKVHMDAAHHTAGFSSNLLPIAPFGSPTVAGEWEASQIVIPNFGGTNNNIEPYVVAVGSADLSVDPTKFSLVEAYANSRSVPQSPDPSVPLGVTGDDNIYRQMFDVGNDDDVIVDNAVGKNDELPYPQNDYPGGANQMSGVQWHDSVQIYSSSGVAAAGVGTQRVKGGNFPCGLIRLDWTPDEQSANLIIQVDLVPGGHRGYLCEPMTEM